MGVCVCVWVCYHDNSVIIWSLVILTYQANWLLGNWDPSDYEIIIIIFLIAQGISNTEGEEKIS